MPRRSQHHLASTVAVGKKISPVSVLMILGGSEDAREAA